MRCGSRSNVQSDKEFLQKAIKDKEKRDKEKLIQAETSETGRVSTAIVKGIYCCKT